MATLKDKKLAVNVDLPTKRARVVVTCKVQFTQLEMFQMEHGLRFRLDCAVWGEDWPDPDDHLFNYASKFFPDAGPTAVEEVTFDRTVSLRVLNEDSSSRDEIYGRLNLRNLESGKRVRAKTNVIKHDFE